MDNKQTAYTPVFTEPKYTYKITIGGIYGLTICVVNPPCLLNRMMQRLILGFEWKKIEQKKP